MRPLMNTNEMTDTLTSIKPIRADRSLTTPSAEANRAAVRSNVQRLLDEIRRGRGRVDLGDTAAVRERAAQYLESCAQTATPPTLSGLYALGFGHSRQSVSQWRALHPSHPTTEFLSVVGEGFADFLASAALAGCVQPVQAIFTLKNLSGWVDRLEVSPGVAVQNEDTMTAEDIAKRYIDV